MEILAHRGASAYEPENTILAINKAFELDADAIEVDVRASLDGYIVVIHDETLDRTTNGKGRVRDYHLNDLRKLDAGRGEKIPTLEEVIEVVAERVPLAIEIKEPPTTPRVCQIVKNNRAEGWVRIVSFYEEAISTAAKLLPNTPRGFIFRDIGEPLQKFFERVTSMQANWIIPKYTITTKELVNEAKQRGFKVLVWTVDDFGTAKRFVALGVNAIATNKPDIKRLLQERFGTMT